MLRVTQDLCRSVFVNGVYKIVMKTQGISRVLKTENQLREMTKYVLTGLVRLHEGKFVQITKYPDSPENLKYVLIDLNMEVMISKNLMSR